MTMLPYVPLDPAIRRRANEAFAVDESGRHQGTLFDAANVLGRRRQVIKDIIEKNPGIASTMDSEGKFDIPWNDRFFAGVTDDDIAKELALRAQRTRVASDIGERARDLDIDFNTQTLESDLRGDIKEGELVRDISTELGDLKGGPELLRTLKSKGPLTSGRLQTARNNLVDTIDKNDPDKILQRTAQQQQIASSQANIQNAANQQRFNQQSLMFDKRQAAENARNRWQDKKDQRRSEALTREMNAENNKMQLQLEYGRLERQDRRSEQERKDRMIMGIIAGFDKVFEGFTI